MILLGPSSWNSAYFFFNYFIYFYSVTIVCIFSPSLHPTPASPTSLSHLYPPPWFYPCVLYRSSYRPLSPLSPPHSPVAIATMFLISMSLVIFCLLVGCRTYLISFWFVTKVICPQIGAELMCLWRKGGIPTLLCSNITLSTKYWCMLQMVNLENIRLKERSQSQKTISLPFPIHFPSPRPRQSLIDFLPLKIFLIRTFHTKGLTQYILIEADVTICVQFFVCGHVVSFLLCIYLEWNC